MNQEPTNSLNDLFKDYKGDYVPSEWDTGAPVGKEHEEMIDALVNNLIEGEAFG